MNFGDLLEASWQWGKPGALRLSHLLKVPVACDIITELRQLGPQDMPAQLCLSMCAWMCLPTKAPGRLCRLSFLGQRTCLPSSPWLSLVPLRAAG